MVGAKRPSFQEAPEISTHYNISDKREEDLVSEPNQAHPTGANAQTLGRVEHLQSNAKGGFLAALSTQGGTLNVHVLADDLVRLRVLRHGQEEPDASWAVAKTDWPGAPVHIYETEEAVTVETPSLTVHVNKADGSITALGPNGAPLLENARIVWDDDTFTLAWNQPLGRRIYGCGEKAGTLERRGKPMEMWNSDHYAYGITDDPLYQSIPFYLGMDGANAHGLFLDNTYRTVWTLGEPGTAEASIQADGGVCDLYLFAGPSPKTVLARYTELTGRMELPPLWGIGYQQSRYSYYPESQVKEIAADFRRHRIPCDVLYLDIHYMDEYKDFTWDAKRFPNPKRMLDELKADGFRMIVILDPGIKVEDDYAPYDELKASGLYVKNADGTPFVGPVWPGDCLFPDFTNPACRAWWGNLYKGLMDDGIAGFWNDMNEPAVFDAEGHTMPPDAQFAGLPGGADGVAVPGDHRRYHNVYGMEMGRATMEGVLRLLPNERPYVLARAGYAGSQRYYATWTGDNVASWEHLRVSIPMVLNLGLSGQAISGPDIGGFVGDPSPELFGRWLQFGALFPFCRVHSAKADYENVQAENQNPQEPWVYGENWTAINRASIELRYELLPYLYTVFEEMTRTGLPVWRPLLLEYPDDMAAIGTDDQFLIGRDLLVAPVVEENATSRSVYLPAGTWYDYWDETLLEGGQTITVGAPLDRLPLFVRAGAALPAQPVVQHTGASDSVPIQWRLYPNGSGQAEGEAYEDDGHSNAFRDGQYRRTRVSLAASGEPTVSAEGAYTSPRPPMTFRAAGK